MAPKRWQSSDFQHPWDDYNNTQSLGTLLTPEAAAIFRHARPESGFGSSGRLFSPALSRKSKGKVGLPRVPAGAAISQGRCFRLGFRFVLEGLKAQFEDPVGCIDPGWPVGDRQDGERFGGNTDI